MPHIKWCQFGELPALDRRFEEALKKVKKQHPQYAFFIDFDYYSKWDDILQILKVLGIAVKHAFFAIRNLEDAVLVSGDILEGLVSRNQKLGKDEVKLVKAQLDSYYTFLNEKASYHVAPDEENIHFCIETDDLLVLHINTIIQNNAQDCFVDAEQISELLKDRKVDTRRKVIVAFGGVDPSRFIDKELFAAICSMYQTNLYMFSSNRDSALEKVIHGESVWKVGKEQSGGSFYLYCVDTENEYVFVKRYVRQTNLIWTIDEGFGTAGNRVNNIYHYGKRYLFEDITRSEHLHAVAFKELAQGLNLFLSTGAPYQEWAINTYELHGEFDYVIEHFVREIIEEDHSSWTFVSFDQAKQQGEYTGLSNDKNVLLICRTDQLDLSRQWLTNVIAQSVIKNITRKYRIVIIRNDYRVDVFDANSHVFNCPQDICNELNLFETRFIKGNSGLNKSVSSISRRAAENNVSSYLKANTFTQYALSVILELYFKRKQIAQDKNAPIIEYLENFLFYYSNKLQEGLVDSNNGFHGMKKTPQEGMSIDQVELSSIEEKENLHD